MIIARFLAFAAALAMLFAPLTMSGAGQGHAMAMPQTMTMDHCAGHSDDLDLGQPCNSSDCIASCTTMATAFLAMQIYTPAPAARPTPVAIPTRLGRKSEFEPPPPRSS